MWRERRRQQREGEEETPGSDPARWRALSICLVAGAMTLLDVSIVNVALPSIRRGLGADDSDLQWIVAGYSLAFGVLLVPAGRLGDARSRRAVFMAGVALFTAASALCGAATDPGWLSIARVVQGLGGGLIAPQVSGFIQNLFSGAERGRAFGYFGASVGLSTAIGPLLGGLLVKAGGPDFGWRLVFYVNLPIGLLVLLLAPRFLPATRVRGRPSLDPLGVLLFAIMLVLVLLPLVEGRQGQPLAERPWWLLGLAAGVGAGFLGWEFWWRRRGRDTLVDLTLARERSYVFGLGLGTLYFAGFTSIFLVMTLYLQVGLHYSPLAAGATQMPFAVGSAVAAWLGGRLVVRYGRWLVVSGLVLVVIGLLAIDLLVPHLTSRVGLSLAPAFLVAGFGGGLVISPNVTITLSEVDPARAGSGGGMLQTAQRVGGAVGVAIVLAQFFDGLIASHGDYASSLSVSLRTTLTFVVAALLLGLADLLWRNRLRRPSDRRSAALVR